MWWMLQHVRTHLTSAERPAAQQHSLHDRLICETVDKFQIQERDATDQTVLYNSTVAFS
jgi:hypothetical protein